MKKSIKNRGVVLIIVIIVIFLMAIVCGTIFSQSMSQGKASRDQMNAIVAEQLAKGLYALNFQKMQNADGSWQSSFNPTCTESSQCPHTLNQRAFAAITTYDSSASLVTVSVSY